MDTNNTPTLNPNTAMVSGLLDTIVNAIADSVMEKVAARLVVLEDRLTANAASAEPGADVAALITRIAGVEDSIKAMLKEVGEKLATIESTVDEHQNTLDDHQGTLDDLPGAGDIVTDDRITELVADELGEQLGEAVTEHLGDYLKAGDIEDALPDDLVRQQALEDAVGTAVSKLRIVIGD
jgi:tetrahydromethanopterin S-methyltransferase subunit B